MATQNKKLYCFVDETGQDAGSKLFIVVAVVVASNINLVRARLEKLEGDTHIGKAKWRKSTYGYRVNFMEEFLLQNNEGLRVYFLRKGKPTAYYEQTLQALQKVLSAYSATYTHAIICIDGLNKTSGKNFTGALRTSILKIKVTKETHDESEVLLRLADRCAGCIRMAQLGNQPYKVLLARATKKGLISEV